MRTSLGNLDNAAQLSFSHHRLSVEIVASVLGVSLVFKLDERESKLDGNITDFAVSIEKSLNISFASSIRNTTQINTRHD